METETATLLENLTTIHSFIHFHHYVGTRGLNYKILQIFFFKEKETN